MPHHDVRAGRELNPWEQSRTYSSRMRGKNIENPTGKKDNLFFRERKLINLSLHSPNTHKVFVQYCTECIGA
jgi:hypothetical protein